MRQIRVSTSGVSISSPVIVDLHGRPEISLQVDVNVPGTATYSVQQTLDNLYDTSITPVWFDHPDTNLVAQTVDRQGNYAYVPAAIRLNQTAGAGSAVLTVIQAGLARA
jgi:hypothetical protein